MRSKSGSICRGVIAAVLTAQAIIFADAPEIFPGEAPDFFRRFFRPKHIVRLSSATRRCRAVEPERQRAARPAQPRDPDGSGSACKKSDRRRAQTINEIIRVHFIGNKFCGRNPESRSRRLTILISTRMK